MDCLLTRHQKNIKPVSSKNDISKNDSLQKVRSAAESFLKRMYQDENVFENTTPTTLSDASWSLSLLLIDKVVQLILSMF